MGSRFYGLGVVDSIPNVVPLQNIQFELSLRDCGNQKLKTTCQYPEGYLGGFPGVHSGSGFRA